MAAIVYSTDTYASSQAITDAGLGNDITQTFSYVTGASLALLITDYIRLCKLPRGAIITNWYMFVPDIESSTGALLVSLGLGGNANLDNLGAVLAAATPLAFLSSSVIGRAGGHINPLFQVDIAGANLAVASGVVAQALPSAPLIADQDLILTATAAATAAGAGGTLKGYVTYNMHYPSAKF